jgi:hypothetical protein
MAERGTVSRLTLVSERALESSAGTMDPLVCRLRAPDHRGRLDECLTPLVQNAVERERGTWWCPRCERYADGSGGFPFGHPLRVRLEDGQSWRRELAEALETQGVPQKALENTGLSEHQFQESA